jgi:hypothetical protein
LSSLAGGFVSSYGGSIVANQGSVKSRRKNENKNEKVKKS